MKTFVITLEDGSKRSVQASDIAAALQVWYSIMGGSLQAVRSIKRANRG